MATRSFSRKTRSARRECLEKVRHACRIDAHVALSATLNGREERMAPYPCKFCHGWHNGHPPRDRYREFEPLCSCRHKAITHDSFPGLGCAECDCVAHREWIYRRAIVVAKNERNDEVRRRKRLAAVFRAVIASLPGAILREIKVELQARFRPDHVS